MEFKGSKSVKIAILKQKIVDINLINKLLKNNSPYVEILAEREDLTFEQYQKIALGNNLAARFNLTTNKSVPLEVLKILATDKESIIRTSLALNDKLPKEIYVILSFDQNISIKSYALKWLEKD
jgi:hypothetical protein